jgi:hypothetical protein
MGEINSTRVTSNQPRLAVIDRLPLGGQEKTLLKVLD